MLAMANFSPVFPRFGSRALRAARMRRSSSSSLADRSSGAPIAGTSQRDPGRVLHPVEDVADNTEAAGGCQDAERGI
jgi:hypothetical protein